MAIAQTFHGYKFPEGTTYIPAKNIGAGQWVVVSQEDVSKRNVAYSVDEYLPWTGNGGQILSPLIMEAVEDILSRHAVSGVCRRCERQQYGEDFLTLNNWYAFWLPTNKHKISVVVYYDPPGKAA